MRKMHRKDGRNQRHCTRNSQETRRTLREDRAEAPYSGTVKSGVLEGDSLERMYDRNYMDYNHYEHNMHDDDEWHDYFND